MKEPSYRSSTPGMRCSLSMSVPSPEFLNTYASCALPTKPALTWVMFPW